MAKKSSAQQPSLYAKAIPAMPEGYYSSGPNPNLRRFVEEHATPYDPATDDYNCIPFAATIIDDSDKSIFDMHPYWAKKPHGAIAQYVSHFTNAGDLVLDPFTGSGGTNSVAAQLNRRSIGIDISPAATFIAKHLCTPHEIKSISATYEEMMLNLAKVRTTLYGTQCHKCGGAAETQFAVWSQTYKCLKCTRLVSHYSCIDGCCPFCGEKIKTRQTRYGYVPVAANIICLEGCKPTRSERSIDAHNPDHVIAFTKLDIAKIEEIESAQVPYWHPTDKFSNDWVSWRPNLAEAGDVSGFFTKRNLWAASSIADWIERHKTNECTSWLLFCLTASIMSISKKAQHLEAGGGYIPGNYVFPPQIKERNVFNSYDTIFRKMIRGLETLNQKIQTTAVLLSTQSVMDLSNIPDNSVDYIFTDPPYSDKVPFGEFNFLWEVWLRQGISWNKDEIIVNPKLGKGLEQWKEMMKKAMSEMYRVLKPGRWITVCYHDSSEGSWEYLQDIFAEVGLISEASDKVLSIQRNRMSWKQATTEQVQKRDLVINFRKPRPDELTQLALLGNEDQATFTEKAQAILTEALQIHPGATADRLYDTLVSRMVRRGEFERHNFEALLNGVAEPIGQQSNFSNKAPVRWYLRATADQIDEAESAKEAAAAERMERYMGKYLTENPEASGVHYSDLFEQYLQVKDKPRRLLQEWLPEFFFKTTEGTWRPPISEEERDQKSTLRTTGALRRIKRFARALLEGVPPAPHDHPNNAATAADWIRQCRRAGLYELGRAIYEKGGFAFGVLSEEAQLEVDEDYQICVRRS